MAKKVWIWVALALLGAVGALFTTSVSQERVVVAGVDLYDTHRLVFGDNVYSQTIQNDRPLLGVGLLLVDIRRSGLPHTIEVALKDDATGTVLAQTTISAAELADDMFAPALFSEPVAATGRDLLLEVRVPEATVDTALGWRIDPEIEDRPRFENGRPREGAFAYSVIQEIPFQLAAQYWFASNTELVRGLIATLGSVGLFMVLSLRLGWARFATPRRRRIEWAVIGLVVVAGVTLRFQTEAGMGGVSGGDPYNYLLISQSLADFENPFVGAKRLPGYPLLLVPAVAFPDIDAQVYMRGLSIVFSAGTLVLLYVLTTQLRFPWPARLGAVALLAFQKDFFATSLRPEPYTLYGMLLMATLVLFFSRRRPWQQYLFGIALGYAAMTRQEGFVLAVILFGAVTLQAVLPRKSGKTGPAAFSKILLGLSHLRQVRGRLEYSTEAYEKVRRGRNGESDEEVGQKARRNLWLRQDFSLAGAEVLLRMFVPALLIVSPFFINSWVQYGNPIYTPYFRGEKLQIVDSWQAFTDASVATWSIMSSMWKPSWTQQELLVLYDHPIIPIALLVALAWWLATEPAAPALGRLRAKRLLAGLLFAFSLAFGAWLVYLLITDLKDLARLTPIVITGILIASPIAFFNRTGPRGLLIAAVFATQMLIALWFHPFPKHYQQSYPFIALALAVTLFVIPVNWSRLVRATALTAAAIPFAMAAYLLFADVGVFVDSHNAQAARDSVDYRATRVARQLPGPYFFEQPSLPADVYLSRSDRIEDVVVASAQANTIITASPPGELELDQDTWEAVEEFRSEGKDEVLYTATVYRRISPL